MLNISKSIAKEILAVITLFMLGFLCIISITLYLEVLDLGVINKYKEIVLTLSQIITIFIIVAIFIFYKRGFLIAYKACILSIFIIVLVMFLIYLFKKIGILDKIDSIDDLRVFIASFGAWAVLIYIALQFAQVVFLPLPSFLTVGAGVMLFGALRASIYSSIGIIAGSLVAFLIGKKFGNKVVSWLVGRDNLDKAIKLIDGKDKLLLTFMFLFPFFPDDILCFVAGITNISYGYFVIMIFITRIISIFSSSFSMGNKLIPFNTWWGILLWCVFIFITVILSVLIYKKGEELEKLVFVKRYKESNKNKGDYV